MESDNSEDRDYIPSCVSLSNIKPVNLNEKITKVSRKRKYKRQFGACKRHPPKCGLIKRVALPQKCQSLVTSSQSQANLGDITSSQISELTPETSAMKKLGAIFQKINHEPQYDIVCRAPNFTEKTEKVSKICSNIVVNPSMLESVLECCTVCRICRKGNVKIWSLGGRSCIGNHLTLRCEFCGSGKDFWTLSSKYNEKIEVGTSTVSRRNDSVYQAVLAGRLIGIGKTGLEIYHSMIGIPNYPSGLDIIHRNLLIVAEYVAKQSMDAAALELQHINFTDDNNLIHEIASFDGAYQKRSSKGGGGFSRYCFASLISMSNSKVIAYDVACNSCSKRTYLDGQLEKNSMSQDEYDKKLNDHLPTCPAVLRDYSSVSLESELAPIVINHALKRKIIIDGLTCDGDNKTFSKLTLFNPYAEIAPQHNIVRYECLSHVGKRMKTHLIGQQKNVIRTSKEVSHLSIDEKSADKYFQDKLVRKNTTNSSCTNLRTSTLNSPSSKNLNKKNCDNGSVEVKFLSDEICARITSFYQLAVKQNLNNPPEILRAIKAIPLHLGANNNNAITNHINFPTGKTSWCHYQRSIAEGLEPPQHPYFLSEECVELIQNVFHQYNYDKEYFVNQVSLGSTSNNNESLHNILFSMVRKTSSVGLDLMKLGSALAVIRYNEGYHGILKILEILKVKIHPGLIDVFSYLDKARVEQSYKISEKQKKRYKSRIRNRHKNSTRIRKFGKSYDSSKFSACFDPPNNHLDEPYIDHVCIICDSNTIDSQNIIETTNLNWIVCQSCKQCYHRICLELHDTDFIGDIWLCPACAN